MSRPKKPFSIVKRSGRPYWYFRIAGGNYLSTAFEHAGHKNPQPEVLKYVLERYDEWKARQLVTDRTLKRYAEPFYVWDTCPHVRRLLAEGKSITRNHVRNQRSVLTNYVLKDEIADVLLAEIRRADILDLRDRLISNAGHSRTVQRAMGVLKTVMKEAYYREDIQRDPTAGIGITKYEKQARGVFTEVELKALFEKCPGFFDDEYDYTVFLLAATVGMRRGELMALAWVQIDFDKKVVTIDRATRQVDGLGAPKWGKVRQSPLPEKAITALKKLRAKSEHVLPDSLVFGWDDGSPRSDMWWRGTFKRAMIEAGFFSVDESGEVHNPRNLVPHSFRHSLNTLLRNKGYNADLIRATMGWSDEAVQDGYTHWSAESFKGQTEILDNLLG